MTFVARRCSFAQTLERRGRGYVCSTRSGRSAVQVGLMVFPAKRLCLVPSMEGVRWAFSCGTWLPSRADWLLAVRSIQPEEKERIGQFVFARDAKAALVLEACGFWEAGGAADPKVRSCRCRLGASGVRGTVFGFRTLGGLGHSQLVLPCEVASGDPYPKIGGRAYGVMFTNVY